jgi:hypothetical protein
MRGNQIRVIGEQIDLHRLDFQQVRLGAKSD